jgi:hypothetical protein
MVVLDGEPSGRRLLAQLVLQDLIDRRVILSVLLHHRVQETGVTIDAGIAQVVTPKQPDTRFFVVPAALLPQPLLGNMTHAELVKLAVENDHLVSPAANPSQPDDYAVLALALDRLPGGDTVFIQPNGGTSFLTEVVDFAGFRVGIARGSFALAELGRSITMAARLIVASKCPDAHSFIVHTALFFRFSPRRFSEICGLSLRRIILC